MDVTKCCTACRVSPFLKQQPGLRLARNPLNALWMQSALWHAKRKPLRHWKPRKPREPPNSGDTQHQRCVCCSALRSLFSGFGAEKGFACSIKSNPPVSRLVDISKGAP